MDHPEINSEDQSFKVRFLLTAEKYINYEMQVLITLQQKEQIQRVVALTKMYPGYGNQV